MQETEKSFNLLDEPWIKVMKPNRFVDTVSLKQALFNAHGYVGLAGELPTQDYAILRLLLAVLFAVFCRVDENGVPNPLKRKNALQRWKALWNMGRFPQKPIEEYLEQWEGRFYLFHPELPFYQVSKSRLFKGEKRSRHQFECVKLIGTVAQSGNKTRLFPNRQGTETETLSFAEAARWLLHINAFDDTAAKTGTGVGWLGKLGIIFAEGDTLFQTLMLNLTLRKDGREEWNECIPVWETEPPQTVPEDKNPAWVLTLQSRHIWLEEQDGRVVSYYTSGGEPSPEGNDFSEQMTIWKRKEDKRGETYFPSPHKFSKQLWREFSSIAEVGDTRRRPGVVSWIAAIHDAKNTPLGNREMVIFRTLSAEYGDSNSSIANLFGDALTFHASLLKDMAKPLRERVEKEVELCGEIAKKIGKLVCDLDFAAGRYTGDDKATQEQRQKRREHGMERYYDRIDQPFRAWLAGLNPEAEDVAREDALNEWRKKAFDIARQVGEELVEQAGRAAFVGRDVEDKKKKMKRHYSAPEAYNRFVFALRKLDG